MKFLQANALSFACLAAMITTGVFMYPGLPETLPTQYNFDGVAGNYLPKLAVVLIAPITYAVTIVGINFMIRFSPQKFSMPNSQRSMDIIIFSVGILVLLIHIGMMVSQGDYAIFQQYFSIGLACCLLLMGNVVGKTERNFFVGIRIPWTIASEQNWRATHRVAGRLMVVSGLLLLAISFFSASLLITLGIGLGWTVISVIYSFLFYLKNERPTSE